MSNDQATHVVRFRDPPPILLRAWFHAFAARYPFWGMVLAILVSNFAGSFFSILYNLLLIVPKMTPEQEHAFEVVAVPLYNVIAYPLCITIMFYLIWPLMRCLRMLRRGEPIDPEFLQFCRRRLVNMPIFQLIVNPIGMWPGAIFFPWIVTTYGAPDNAGTIWEQFLISFSISTVFTTVQTFFILQGYLTGFLYAEFFKDTRPEDVPGIKSIPFNIRMMMMWSAVALMPMAAILAVAESFASDHEDSWNFVWFLRGLVFVSAISSGSIFRLVGRDVWRWIHLQTEATGEIAKGHFDIRIDHPRPDEWGRLINRFNDMAMSLNQAWESHETLGQLVSPEVRDQILHRMRGFDVERQEITVLFVDIRNFTPRCAGQSPESIGMLLNRFLTLALRSIEEKGGYVNKFLGDGVMALFGATHEQLDHADLAIASAREMLERLEVLNADLVAHGQAPLAIGIGIHTGQALVGCFGAILQDDTGKPLMRREFTAIGETVNLCQRVEQLTKTCGGPILISEGTRARLQGAWTLECVGPQALKGSDVPMVVYKVVGG